MPRYHVSLRNCDGHTIVQRSLVHPDLAAAWTTVGEIARQAKANEAGRILVKDSRGEVVILVGVASARVLAQRQEDTPDRLPRRPSTAWPS